MKKFYTDPNDVNMTPVIEGIRCKALAYGLFFALAFLPLVVGLYVGFVYDWLIAVGVILFLYLASSIVGSKLRVSSVPPELRERSLSSMDIAKWYVHQYHC